MRILIVEDDEDLCEAIAEGLRMDGYAVDTCGDGNHAYELLYVENYDLAILDLNLPGLDGLEVLQKIRREESELKVLILSARGSVEDKVSGLDLGANDYLTKPFDFAELEARIRNLLRWKFVQENNELSCNGIVLKLSERTAYVAGRELVLTNKEFGLLEYFMMNQDRVLSQEELIDHVWDGEADNFSGAIRVHIASLRKKLKTELGFNPIVTRIGKGYQIQSFGRGEEACDG